MNTTMKWLAGLTLATTAPLTLAAEQIDVLILYTEEATTTRTGQDINARIASYIEYSNQAYRNSQIGMELRLVGALPTDSRFRYTNADTLAAFRTDRTVNQLRQQYGADLVVLVNMPTSGICGIGYQPGGNESTGRFHSSASAYGFSAVGVSCGYVTFPHELGHNMSLGHSFVQNSPGGVFPWGRGHGVSGSFSTVMAYPQSYNTRNHLQEFSNPVLNRCNGLPCGSPTNRADGADASTALNRLASQVANFMPTVVIDDDPDDGDNGGNPDGGGDTGGNPGNGGGSGGGNGSDLPVCDKPDLKENNLLAGSDFNDLSPWSNFMNAGNLDTVTVVTSCGRDNRLQVTDRRAYYAGPIQDIQGGLEPGAEYRITALLGLSGSASRDSVRMTLQLTDNAGTRYQNLPALSVTGNELSGYDQTFTIESEGALRSARLLINGPAAGTDFVADEIKLVKVSDAPEPDNEPSVLVEESFENGGNGWAGYMSTWVYRSRSAASDGNFGLVSTFRNSIYSGPGFEANGYVVPGESYTVSVDVLLQNRRLASDKAELWAWFVDSDGGKWQRLGGDTIATGSWNTISAGFSLDNNGPVSQIRLHVMGADPSSRMVIDNFRLGR